MPSPTNAKDCAILCTANHLPFYFLLNKILHRKVYLLFYFKTLHFSTGIMWLTDFTGYILCTGNKSRFSDYSSKVCFTKLCHRACAAQYLRMRWNTRGAEWHFSLVSTGPVREHLYHRKRSKASPKSTFHFGDTLAWGPTGSVFVYTLEKEELNTASDWTRDNPHWSENRNAKRRNIKWK